MMGWNAPNKRFKRKQHQTKLRKQRKKEEEKMQVRTQSRIKYEKQQEDFEAGVKALCKNLGGKMTGTYLAVLDSATKGEMIAIEMQQLRTCETHVTLHFIDPDNILMNDVKFSTTWNKGYETQARLDEFFTFLAKYI